MVKVIEHNKMNCLNCKTILVKNSNEKNWEFRRRKFCNKSCSASYNNKNRIKKVKKCLYCNSDIVGKSVRKFCSRKCSSEQQSLLSQKARESTTKKELFERRGSWQSARAGIQKDARTVYLKSGKPMECKICGYSKHVEVCHIISVSEFSEDSTFGEINNPNNLVGLCPNHHWEFDNGFIQIAKCPETDELPNCSTPHQGIM